jgi:hypothetical protein
MINKTFLKVKGPLSKLTVVSIDDGPENTPYNDERFKKRYYWHWYCILVCAMH